MNKHVSAPKSRSKKGLERANKELLDYKFALDQFAVVTITDIDGEIISANDKFCEVSKYSREELIGQTHRIVNSGYHSKGFFEELWGTVRDGKIWKGEVCNKAKDGICYWADTTIVPFMDESGNPYQYLAVRIDITLRKEMEEKVREAMEVKSQFISLVSHELRTPLTAIKQGIDIVGNGTVGKVNKEQKEFLVLAKNNVDRLARLINGVLDFQKLQAGKMEFSIEEHSLNEAAVEVYKTMKPLAEEKGIDLLITTDERLLKIKFDRDKVVQVITNFVKNSIKFTEQGAIEIVVEKRDNAAHVMVKDTGIGFSGKEKHKLFRSFEQLTGGKKFSGSSGLGLAISKEIIDRHSGEIWADSQEGKGSVFHFTLPIIEHRGQKN